MKWEESGIKHLERNHSDWDEWRDILYAEWASREQGDPSAIPRYAIARMFGSGQELAKDCIEE